MRTIEQTKTSLIIVGHSGAGKTTLGTLLHQHIGARVIEIGHLVINEASLQSYEISALEYADVKFRAGKSLHFVEQVAATLDLSCPVVVVGPRRPEEVKFLKEILHSSVVIGLDARNQVREIRRCGISVHRGQKSWLSHRDEVERDWGAENTLMNADVVLDSTRAPAHLLEQTLAAWSEFSKPCFQERPTYSLPASDQIVTIQPSF